MDSLWTVAISSAENITMQSKVLFVLLSAFALIDFNTATEEKELVSILCYLARNNGLWFQIASRQCLTGCLGDPKSNPIILFNQCEPIQDAPGTIERRFYRGLYVCT